MMFTPREEGQGLLEYAMIIILVAMIVFLVIYFLGPTVANLYVNVMTNI